MLPIGSVVQEFFQLTSPEAVEGRRAFLLDELAQAPGEDLSRDPLRVEKARSIFSKVINEQADLRLQTLKSET